MGVLDAVSTLLDTVGLLAKLAFVGVITVVGWQFVPLLIASGDLPPAPLGLAELGLPSTLFGIPIVYAAGILLFDALVLFGGGGGSSRTGGMGDADGVDGGFGGGFGGGGDGGGGGGE